MHKEIPCYRKDNQFIARMKFYALLILLKIIVKETI